MTYRDSRPVFDLSPYDVMPHFIALSLTDKDGNVVADNFYVIGKKGNAYDWKRTKWYYTPITRWEDLSFAFSGEVQNPEMKIEKNDEGYSVTLTNTAEKISYMNILKALDKNGNLVVPAIWSDNFFPLLPGQSKTVTCKVRGDVEIKIND